MTTLPDRLEALDPEHRLAEVWELRVREFRFSRPGEGYYEKEDADAALLRLLGELAEMDSFDGHMRWLDKHYPPATFDGSSGDPGPTIVKLTRELAEARSEVERLRGMLEKANPVRRALL